MHAAQNLKSGDTIVELQRKYMITLTEAVDSPIGKKMYY